MPYDNCKIESKAKSDEFKSNLLQQSRSVLKEGFVESLNEISQKYSWKMKSYVKNENKQEFQLKSGDKDKSIAMQEE